MSRTRVNLTVDVLDVTSDLRVDGSTLTSAIESKLSALVQRHGLPPTFAANNVRSTISGELRGSLNGGAVDEATLASDIAGAFWK